MKDQAECINCVIRLPESSDPNSYRLKQLGYIFNMDTSLLERRFRKVKGIKLKAYFDEGSKDNLICLLREGNGYGCEYANVLGFSSDYSFYR